MGACASKPKDLDSQEAPAPVEAPATPKAEVEAAPQESDGVETKKEEPLVDLSEPAPEAPKEVATETKTAEGKEEAKSSESSEEIAKPSEEKAETVEAANEPEKEEKKEVADAAAA